MLFQDSIQRLPTRKSISSNDVQPLEKSLSWRRRHAQQEPFVILCFVFGQYSQCSIPTCCGEEPLFTKTLIYNLLPLDVQPQGLNECRRICLNKDQPSLAAQCADTDRTQHGPRTEYVAAVWFGTLESSTGWSAGRCLCLYVRVVDLLCTLLREPPWACRTFPHIFRAVCVFCFFFAVSLCVSGSWSSTQLAALYAVLLQIMNCVPCTVVAISEWTHSSRKLATLNISAPANSSSFFQHAAAATAAISCNMLMK